MDLETDAEEAWELLKKQNRLFPYRCCKFAVREINSRGYEIIVGWAHLDNYCSSGKPHKIIHYWNRDPETKKNFDITASGLNIHLSDSKRLPKIAIWSGDNHPVYEKIKEKLEPHDVV